MNALTICQPFVELILTGRKRVENRSWKPTEPGRILLHAGKNREWLTLNDRQAVDQKYGIAVSAMAFGAIVGTVDVVDCVYLGKILQPEILRKYPWLTTHPHVSGPWCWILENVVRFEKPIPCRGNQGLWSYDGPLP